MHKNSKYHTPRSKPTSNPINQNKKSNLSECLEKNRLRERDGGMGKRQKGVYRWKDGIFPVPVDIIRSEPCWAASIWNKDPQLKDLRWGFGFYVSSPPRREPGSVWKERVLGETSRSGHQVASFYYNILFSFLLGFLSFQMIYLSPNCCKIIVFIFPEYYIKDNINVHPSLNIGRETLS